MIPSCDSNWKSKFLLQHIIYKSFNTNAKRLWVHTCTLDHKNAYKNYISRGFKIFKEEEIDFEI